MPERVGCKVCDTVAPGDLVELDLIMGDSSRWPDSVWRIFEPPKVLTPAYRRWGAVEMGLAWLTDHGYTEITKANVRKHYRYDVVIVAASADEIADRGVIAAVDARRTKIAGGVVDPTAYLGYFDRGIRLGNRALELLERRVEQLIEAREEVPLGVLKMLADLGSKLAITQAQIRARGKYGDEGADEDEGFRVGSSPPASPRMGHARIRTIDGVARPVRDEGPADRARYNAAAEQQGGTTLPSR